MFRCSKETSGFTLFEVIIAMGILLMVVTGISQIYRNNSRFIRSLDQESVLLSILRENPAEEGLGHLRDQGTVIHNGRAVEYLKTEKEVYFEEKLITGLREIQLELKFSDGNRAKVNYYVDRK